LAHVAGDDEINRHPRLHVVYLNSKGKTMEDKSLWKASALLLLVGLLLGSLMWYWNQPDKQGAPIQAASDATATGDKPSMDRADTASVDRSDKADKAPAMAVFASPFTASATANTATGITGRWGGEIDLGGNKALFNFNLRETEGLLAGTATFPVGEGSIEDGKIANNQLSFATRHRLPSNGQVLVTKFSGTVGDGTISLTMLSEGGQSKLTLNPQPR
jgi:hypothetical protein